MMIKLMATVLTIKIIINNDENDNTNDNDNIVVVVSIIILIRPVIKSNLCPQKCRDKERGD